MFPPAQSSNPRKRRWPDFRHGTPCRPRAVARWQCGSDAPVPSESTGNTTVKSAASDPKSAANTEGKTDSTGTSEARSKKSGTPGIEAQLALIQADIRRTRPKAQEKLRTLQIKKEAEWKGAKLLFVSYEEGGIPKFEVAGLEKDASSGLWFPKHFSRYSLPDDAKSLKQAIEAWESDGTLK